ncbi:hypothetical protein [Pseudonocardia sp.]|uniref:hypothetical protein n=1 Tax=Pseudonocardia sp. TaxID=60912 RepID=UPI003D0A38B1
MIDPDDVVGWLRECSVRLMRAAEEIGRIADRVERSWADEQGREWGDRAGLVRRRLDREAVACRELADQVARTEPGEEGAGPVLGSTAARRVDAGRGMRIAVLGDADRGVRGG